MLLITIIFLTFSNGLEKFKEVFDDQKEQLFKNGKFNYAFMTFFYFYSGFENFSSVSKNVEKPETSIKRAIVYVLAISTFIYIFESILIIGSFGRINISNVLNGIAFKVFSIFGIIAVFLQVLFLKFNGTRNILFMEAIC
jgi:amino acid transporter